MTLFPLSKEHLALISILFAVLGYVPYLWMMWTQRVRPHIFSWGLWGTMALIVYLAQSVNQGGAGTWATATTAMFCYLIAIFALPHGRKTIRRIDWIVLSGALVSIPLWIMTQDALYSVILLCVMNVLATLITIRKAWENPFHESTYIFAVQTCKLVFSCLALSSFAPVVILFPICDGLMNLTIIAVVFWRRCVIRRNNSPHSVI